MNETDTRELVMAAFEYAPKEIKFAMAGIVGAILINEYVKNAIVNSILARGESVLKSSVSLIYSFFKPKKVDRSTVMLATALEEYAQLVPAMNDELESLLVAMIEKQQGKYDPNVVKLIETLRVDIAHYPELSSGMVAEEVEQVIKARKVHHQKILLDITHYLDSSFVDESTQSYNNRKEI